MIFQHTIDKVLNQKKTSTTRPVNPGDVLKLVDGIECVIAVDGRIRWAVGRTYSVQPGRCERAVGRIRVIGLIGIPDPLFMANISREYLRDEGYQSYPDFSAIWRKMHGDKPTPSWVIGFELVK